MGNWKRYNINPLLTRLKELVMAKKHEDLSIIDKNCSVEGTLKVKGKLIIAGSLKGTLIGNTVVTVKGSRVNVQAKVREMVIGGECEGDVAVYEDLRILSTGIFSGKMTCKNISLEAGGKLNGRVRLIGSTEGPSAKPVNREANRASAVTPKVEAQKAEAQPSRPD
jgi:cytoskeletal protein CcmA (bactofilin family)